MQAVVAHLLSLGGVHRLDRFRIDAYPDELFGVSTGGVTAPEHLSLNPSVEKHAVRYEATPPYEFRHAMAALPIDHSRYTFIDYGSGKGRVLLLAAEFPFAAIRGVEASHTLHEIAVANIARIPPNRMARSDVAAVEANAAQYRPERAPLVAFMFNPFDEVVLAPALDRIADAAARSAEPSYLVYKNPQHSEMVDSRLEFTLRSAFFAESLLVYGVRAS